MIHTKVVFLRHMQVLEIACTECGQSNAFPLSLLSRVLVFENVHALLSSNVKCRKIFEWLLKACHLFSCVEGLPQFSPGRLAGPGDSVSIGHQWSCPIAGSLCHPWWFMVISASFETFPCFDSPQWQFMELRAGEPACFCWRCGLVSKLWDRCRRCASVCWCSLRFKYLLSLLLAMEAADFIHYFGNKAWNHMNNIQPERFLTNERGEVAKRQIKTMGNIVIPQQAFTALCVLTHMASVAAQNT